MRKASIFFLVFGVILGFIWGSNSLRQAFGEVVDGDDEDEPEPVLKTGACKPWCRLV